jgi:enoyl-CoA hydratase / long-chain 3-hydroxyacyl-CoA dehydrogenase
MLGLLPGAGGTQRVQKLTSVPTTLDLALTGKTIKADRAKKLGLIDLLVEPLGPGLQDANVGTIQYLENVAVGVAKDLSSGKLKVNRQKTGLVAQATEFVMGIDFVKDQIFKKARQQVMKMSGGLYPAPLRILDVVRVGADKGFEAGLEAERNAFGELSQTTQSKGLIGLFRGQTECKKNRFGTPERPTKNVSFNIFRTVVL